MIATNTFLNTDSATDAQNGQSRLSQFQFTRPDDDVVRDAGILIIDDEPGVGAKLKQFLNDAGFRKFDLLTNTESVVEHVTRTLPDLILLDINVAGIDGLELLKQLRNSPFLHHIAVVILTRATDEDTRRKALDIGADDFLSKPVAPSELVARIRNTLSTKVYRDRVIHYTLQLESDVLNDALTGIPNRRAFDYELKRRMSEWRRQKTPLALVMLDIDHFKSFNDRFGHAVGDRAIQHVAGVIRETMRDMDLVARFGGEEFSVILPATSGDAARSTCAHAVQQIAQHPLRVDDTDLDITVSAGLAVVGNGDDAELLLRRADTALYAAKQNGRNCSYEHNGAVCLPLASPKPARSAAPTRSASAFSSDHTNVHDARIAIVDDDSITIAVAGKHLADAGFSDFLTITDSTEAVDKIAAEKPDLILLDLMMPRVNGYDILNRLRDDRQMASIPVVVLTASQEKQAKIRALDLGAVDFLEKPIVAGELCARVRNTLMAKAHVDMLRNYSARLEHEVQVRTTELIASRREAVQCLARAAELRDDVTGRHVLRVGRFAAIIAEELGFSADRVDWMEHAAQLHDVGKIGIPDSILSKPGKLTDAEFDVVKGHCVAGRSIIRDEIMANSHSGHADPFDNCTSPLMNLASVVAATHHEKWDGTGYPGGLKGTEIPIEGRITAVADVFDALSTHRPYKAAIPFEECFRIMQEKRGTHFDPTVLDAFFRRRSEIIQTATDYADVEPSSE